MGGRKRDTVPIAELLDRFERTGLGGDLLAVTLPDEPVASPRRRRGDDLRDLAVLRWYRYLLQPGVTGLAERRALLAVLARFGKRRPDLPDALQEFEAAARRPSAREPETVGPARIDQLMFLRDRYDAFGEAHTLDTASELAIRWLDEARLPYERAALRTYVAETAFRYGRAGAAGGYEAAEGFAAQALRDTENGDPHRANRTTLKGRCAERRTGPEAEARAVADYRRAAVLAARLPGGGVEPLRLLSALTARRHESARTSATLTEALTVARDLDRATPPDDPRAAGDLARFTALRAEAIQLLGEKAVAALLDHVADPNRLATLFAAADDGNAPLTDRRAAARTLLSVLPFDHPDQVAALLTAAYVEHDLWLSGAADTSPEDARDLAFRAVDAAKPGGDPLRRAYSALAEILVETAVRLSEEHLADQAVAAIRLARDLVPENSPDGAGVLGHLADLLVGAASVLDDPSLLPDAVELRRAAVLATPVDGAARPFWLANLAASLKELAHVESDAAAMEEAVSVGRQALDALPAGDPMRVGLLFNLAAALSSPVRGTPAPERVAESERLLAEGQALLPDGHPDHARFGSVRAWLRYLHHGSTGERDALVTAVALARAAVAATPSDDQWLAERSRYLATASAALYQLDGEQDQALRAEAIAAYSAVAESPHASAGTRMAAQRSRAELAGDPAVALEALESALADGLRMSRRSLAGTIRLGAVHRLGGLAVDAAAAAIAAGRPEHAVELLERSRAVLYSEALTARRYWEPLREVDPRAAAELERIESRLAEADLYANVTAIKATASVRSTSGRVTEKSSTTTDPRPGWAAETRRLAAERDRILARLAEHPRFEEWLRPPMLAELRDRTVGAPVVLVLAHRDGGHALIVPAAPADAIQHVPLPDVTEEAVLARIGELETAVADAIDVTVSFDRRETAQEELHGVLEWLWDTVTGPVLAEPAVEGMPRVWWCPVGAMVRLPLHAAGHHREPDRDRTVLDRVVSSYTPTIGTLAHTRRDGADASAGVSARTLVIAAPDAPGAPPLPHAEAEADEVLALVPGARALVGAAATLPAVEAAMTDASIVHFACHGAGDTALTLLGGSGLRLGSGETLTAVAVHDARLVHGELAFLSACGTAEPHAGLPDEPMHLAAAFQLAGFRGVIGTMWRTPDSQRVARAVYTGLTGGGGSPPDPRRAATALNDALRAARDAYPAVPTRWAAYLHVGA